jgi:hypothetical protein
MRTKLTKITLAATLALAITFTINACSSSDDDNGGIHDDGSLSSLPGYQEWQEELKYYDPLDASQKCLPSGIVEYKCKVDNKDVWYNPLTHRCHRGISCGGDVDGGYSCDTTYYGFGAIERCGNRTVDNIWRRCKGGVIEEKCETAGGDKWINTNTHYCDYAGYDPETGRNLEEVKAKELCGSVYYEPDGKYSVCKNGVVGAMCGGEEFKDGEWVYGEGAVFYNDDTHYCKQDFDMETFSVTYTVKPRVPCGNRYIGPDEYERCNNGVVEYVCGGRMEMGVNWYNSITQTCNDMTGEVRGKVRCGS